MIYRQLGKTDIQVSALCLGTMTWGEQNTLAEAHQQLDYAFERGINFIDTAELYPVPPQEKTYAETERIIGQWKKMQTERDKIILATKVVGPMDMVAHIRDAKPRLNKKNISLAIDQSLKRLKTDYVDLYQLHWPDRSTNFFGQLGFIPHDGEESTPLEKTLEALGEIVAAKKVRYIGLSNETPWGLMKFLSLAEKMGLPEVVSIQNPYNLLNRSFEIGLAEISYREKVGLLAYSPLGFGVLTGKYLGSQFPPGARLSLWKRFSRYTNQQAIKATEKYVSLAREHQLSPTQMALAFVTSRPFVAANIIGATSMKQLQENIESIDLEISPEVFRSIDEIHQEFCNPCP